ncbi:glycosyltransferase family 2 protein [Salinisphaera sp. LB1]|uniref:glycosyltransferase family 2 protein n=1 Tax=Salinisphaera sp. LB1 TaxID=2183911 RepID=UPI000D70828D|nr:glycosyltransferase family 2 protein [Salinisphaera sp. LB1]AWN17343.1 Beta-1,3-glucosyltransferase [Salinisphaera sp. LB1]
MTEISVIIPVYNRAHYIVDAIRSVLDQRDAPAFEILVVDDGSTDDSVARAAAIDDPRIRIITGHGNQGIAVARNRGIAEASGHYIAFLDSDDLARPERLARQARFLDAHPEHAAVGAWIGWIDADGRRLKRVKRKPTGSRQIAAERLFRSGIENSAAMARSEILRAYPHRESLAVGSDYDLWARIAADHPLAGLPCLLVDRRQHPAQATAKHVAQDRHYRCQIFAAQLEALGIDFCTADLERHYHLRRLGKGGERADSIYIDWAERWLQRLKDANRQKRLYPEPEFSGVLAVFWAGVCWHAANRRAGLWRLVRAPLSRPLLTGSWHALSHRSSLWSALARRPSAV